MSTISINMRDLVVFIMASLAVTGCTGIGVDMPQNETGEIVTAGTKDPISKKSTDLPVLYIQQLKITEFTDTCEIITAVVSVMNNSVLVTSPSFTVSLQGTIQRINVPNQNFAPLVISRLQFPALQPHKSVLREIQIRMPINMLPISTGKFEIYDYSVWLSAEAVYPKPENPIDLNRESTEMNNLRYTNTDLRCTISG